MALLNKLDDIGSGDAERGVSFAAWIEFVGMWEFSLFDPHLNSTRADAEFFSNLAGIEYVCNHVRIIRIVRIRCQGLGQ